MRFRWLALLLILAACRGTGSDGFPSLLPRPAETPRNIDAAARPAEGIPDEVATSLQVELDRDQRELDLAAREIATIETALVTALRAARGAAPGTTPWIDAQILLSRHDQARAHLSEIEARLLSYGPKLDGVPDNDPALLRWKTMVQQVEDLAASAGERAEAANRALGV